MVKIWKAREAVIHVSDAITVDADDPLDTQVAAGGSATTIEDKIKNVTVVEPEGAVDKQDFLGETGGFQNADLDEKPFGLATISGTLVQIGDEVLEAWTSGTGTSVTGGYTRYQMGASTSGKTRKAAAILVDLDDTTDKVGILLNNALITKLGDRRIAGPDGHWEQDFNAICLPKDFYVEFKN